MHDLIARRIVEVAEDAGIELRLQEDYSGRAMYGETTYGVVGSLSGFMQAVVMATESVVDDENNMALDAGGAPISTDKLVRAMSSIRTDSMGRSTIFY